MNWHLATVVALAVTVSLQAQDPPPVVEQRDQGRLEERAQSMREQIDTGKQVKSHVRVAVRFKNGNKLVGVVKDGRLVERVDGLRFVDAQARDRGAGIRLWYTSGARNYVFVPFADFTDYQVLQRLTAEQLAEFEVELQRQEGRRAEREAEAARLAAVAKAARGEAAATTEGEAPMDGTPPSPAQETATPAAEGANQPKTKDGAETTKAGEQVKPAANAAAVEQQREWFSLLQAYPPAAGWGKAKRDEIARRRVVVGAKPSEQEQRFVDKFAEWEMACKHFAVDTETKVEDTPAPAPAGRRKKS